MVEEFVAVDGPAAAERLVSLLIARGEGLGDSPRPGRSLPERLRDDLREIVVRGYRIACRLRDDGVEILPVFEGHRLLDAEELADGDEQETAE